jgi:PAS domain S-box-containing protein
VLVEQLRDYAVFALDREGRIVTWNAGAELIEGYRPEEILGEHRRRFYLPEDVARGKPDAELTIARREGRFADDSVHVRADGSLFWASVVLNPLRGPAGQLLGFAEVIRDIGELPRTIGTPNAEAARPRGAPVDPSFCRCRGRGGAGRQ